MSKFFSYLGNKIQRHPFRSVIALLVIFGAFIIIGIPQMQMATGNNTLVQEDNEVYQSNLRMEEEFGADPIIVLFYDTSEEGANLFSYDNLNKIHQIEKELSYESGIHTIISPAALVDQMANMMGDDMMSRLPMIAEGLETMSLKMEEVSQNLKENELPDFEVLKTNIQQMSGMLEVFYNSDNDLSLESLQEEFEKMQNIDPQLINQMSTLMGQEFPDFEVLQVNMGELMDIMGPLAETLNQDSINLETLQTEFDKLDNFDFSQLTSMLDNLSELASNLGGISQGLKTIHSRSDIFSAGFPESEETLNMILYEDEEQTNLRSIFNQIRVDDNHYRMVISLKGESQLEDGEKNRIISKLDALIDQAEFETITPVVSGKPILDNALQGEMRSNMIRMVVMVIIIMIIVLILVFNVRWRLMSLVTVFFSVIATLGLMSILKVPITMVSMAVFPILIGLGINYSIQFHNRYEEELSVKTAISNVGQAVTIAVVATMLGFISLYMSPVPMIQDFGSMLTIGVFLALLAAVFFLPSTLQILDANQARLEEDYQTKLGTWDINRLIVPLTKMIVGLRWPIIIATVLLAMGGFAVDGKVGVETNIENFMPQDLAALEDIRYIRDVVGSTDQVTIHLEDEDSILRDENIEWIGDLTAELAESYPEEINNIQSLSTILDMVDEAGLAEEGDSYSQALDRLPESQRKMLINEDYTESVIILGVDSLPSAEMEAFINELKQEIADAPMEANIAGASALNVELVDGLTKGRIEMTLVGLALVFFILMIIYRSISKPIAVVLPVLFIVGMSSGIMYLLGIDFTPITSTLGALILGMGTEMNIMIMERYLEERKRNLDKFEAIQVAAESIGKANLASALTTIGGFSVLMFSSFIILKDFGLMTVINVSLATLSTFIVMPAILTIMDKSLVNNTKK